jgi:hypothetical protein
VAGSDVVRADAEWLELREPADALARSDELADALVARLAPGQGLVVHDLGSGTGSMARWLAPRLPGPQHWVLHDRDDDLLERVSSYALPATADGSPVTLDTRRDDITRLDDDGLREADLITGSALLDMLTAAEVERVVAACVGVGCPVLMTLSVVGRVELEPPERLDSPVTRAFNDHQRRTTGQGDLLGPDAAAAAVAAFEAAGLEVVVRGSPWRLGADQRTLVTAWLTGWVRAAVEQVPDLADDAERYLRRRLEQAVDGTLSVTVHHDDLLAVPAASARGRE